MTDKSEARYAAEGLAGLPGCLDCDADTELVEIGPGLYSLRIMHDDTCPTYRLLRREGLAS